MNTGNRATMTKQQGEQRTGFYFDVKGIYGYTKKESVTDQVTAGT